MIASIVVKIFLKKTHVGLPIKCKDDRFRLKLFDFFGFYLSVVAIGGFELISFGKSCLMTI